MSKENFKEFVNNNPTLVNYVRNNEMTWQKFYEMYDLYGENNDIWEKYLKKDEKIDYQGIGTSIKNIFDLFKGVDLKTVQKTLNSLDKAIDTFRGISNNNPNTETSYENRPTNRYYED